KRSHNLTKDTLGATLLRADKLSRFHPAVARRLVRRAIAETKGNMRSIDLIHVERIMQLAAQKDGRGRTQIPGLDIFRSFEWLRVAAPSTELAQAQDYSLALALQPGIAKTVDIPGTVVTISLKIQESVRDRGLSAYNEVVDDLDWNKLSVPLELRNWHPGDELQPAGRSKVKIKRLFQERRVPIWERETWPVLARGSEIVWALLFGPSELYRPVETTQCVLRIRTLGVFYPESHESKIPN
ncbi:MAG: tRNA lysidine(34) synthetase TilS, partial [Bryobacteraceae bacterium]